MFDLLGEISAAIPKTCNMEFTVTTSTFSTVILVRVPQHTHSSTLLINFQWISLITWGSHSTELAISETL